MPAAIVPCKGLGQSNNRDNCVILVAVTETASSCTVQVDASQASVVFDRFVRDRLIVWKLDVNPGGYEFPEDGTKIKAGRDPFGNFDAGTPWLKGQYFIRVNVNNLLGIGEFPYTVKVENPIKGIRCEQDPLIRNQ
jgi:hypothetical protein